MDPDPIDFGRIEGPAWRADRVVICGQGPSWRHVAFDDLLRAAKAGATLVLVNGAIDVAEALQAEATGAYDLIWFTLDHSPENRERVANPIGGVRYVQAVPEDYPHERHGHVTYLRRIAAEEPDPSTGPFRERVRRQIVGGLAEDPGEIYTGNSGFGALGVAYHMGASRIALLGIDGAGTERHDGTRNRYLGHMPDLFAGAVPQLINAGVRVVNGSIHTALKSFPVFDSTTALNWVAGI